MQGQWSGKGFCGGSGPRQELHAPKSKIRTLLLGKTAAATVVLLLLLLSVLLLALERTVRAAAVAGEGSSLLSQLGHLLHQASEFRGEEC